MKKSEVKAASDWQLVKRLVRLPSPSKSGEALSIVGELGRREALTKLGYLDFPTFTAWHEWAEKMFFSARPVFKALVSAESE